MRGALACLVLAGGLIGCAVRIPLAGTIPDTNERVSGEVTVKPSGGEIYFSAVTGRQCEGKVTFNLTGSEASGQVGCRDGRSGAVSLTHSSWSQKGKGSVDFNDGSRLIFNLGGEGNMPSYPVIASTAAQGQGVGQSGATIAPAPVNKISSNYDGLILDLENADLVQFEQDLKACKRLRKEAKGDVLAGAVVGAAFAALDAEIDDEGYGKGGTTRAGAATGAIDEMIESDEREVTVFRNCLIGRGYRVLN